VAYGTTGEVRPLWQILSEDMSDEQKMHLMSNLVAAFKDINYADLAMLGGMILTTRNLQDRAIKVAIDYANTIF
jgi:hypothetical protein